MRRHECHRCGRHNRPEHTIRSAWTKHHYCADLEACTRRARRRDRDTAQRINEYGMSMFAGPTLKVW